MNSREKFTIEMNRVAMRRKLRRNFCIDFLARRICVGGVEIRERPLCAIEEPAGSLQRDDGIVEGRFFRAGGDRINFLELFAHASFDRRNEMFVFDLIKRRRVIRKSAFHQKWIVASSW